jgi:predicted RND superfamily exporter protein
MAKKPKNEENPKVHKDLDGFKMNINSFGEISSSFSIDKLNEFLNKNVEDKKLKDREDIDDIKEGKKKKKK